MVKIAQRRDCQAEQPRRNDHQTSLTLALAEFQGPQPEATDS